MTNNAKEIFANSFRHLLQKKSFSHITVTDIACDCGVSRQAFYYHFTDIYQLLEWILDREIRSVFTENTSLSTWQNEFCNLLVRVRENHAVVGNVFRGIEREYLENCLHTHFYDIIYPLVLKESSEFCVDEKNKEFIAHFFSLSVVAIGIDWFSKGMKEEPEEISKKIALLVRGDLKKALKNYEISSDHAVGGGR